MLTLWQDLRYGTRMLIKHRGVTLFSLFALAIGIGANSTIFSMANSILLSPWPFKNPERIMRVGEKRVGHEIENLTMSGPNYLEWKEYTKSFEETCIVTLDFLNLTGDEGVPEEIRAYMWSPNVSKVYRGVDEGALGRQFFPDEDEVGKDHVTILGYVFWSERYGGDPEIIGKTIQLDGEAYTVIGVLPASSSVFEAEAKLWIPIPKKNLQTEERDNRKYSAFGLLKPGVTVDQARAEMQVVSENLARQFKENEGWEIGVEPALQNLIRSFMQMLIVLHGAVGFVLLIACSIVASLLLARGAARRKEISIRIALGASRVRVFRQILTECVLLSVCGGIAGLALAVWGIGFLKSLLPEIIGDYVTRQGVDIRLLAFTMIVSVLTGLVFGLVPALRTSKVSISESLKEGGRGSVSRSGSHRMLRFLVVSEIAACLILLVGAGLMTNSFIRLQKVNPGFESDDLLIFHVALRGTRYEEDHQRRGFYRDIVPKIQQLPGVTSVAAANVLPMNWQESVRFEVGGQAERADGEPYAAQLRNVHPDYFATLGIKLKLGRYFTPEEDREESFRIIVNETFVKRILPGKNPIEEQLTVPDWGSTAYSIVGVVGDVRSAGLIQDPVPSIYVPFMDQPATSLSFGLRSNGDPLKMVPAVRDVIWANDPELPVIKPRTMDDAIAQGTGVAMSRFAMILLSGLSVIALVLSAIGIYGMMAYSVSQRTQEIGIRMALGARISDVINMVVKQGLVLTLIGVAIGAGGAFLLMKGLSGLLAGGVSATDPVTFLCTAVLLTCVSLVACYIPARRSARVDPMTTLRSE